MQSILSFILDLFDYIIGGLKNRDLNVSLLLIVFANLISLFGILIFNWPLSYLLFLYWCESALIGILNIGKILLVAIRPGIKESFLDTFIRTLGGICVSVFFIFYFGLFLMVALMFALSMASIEGGKNEESSFFESAVNIIQNFFYIPSWNSSLWEILDNGFIVLIFIIILLIREFYNSYYKEKVYLHNSYSEQIKYPFPRIIILVVTVVFGGLLASGLSLLLPSLKYIGMAFIWIFMKFMIDIHYLTED